LLLRRAHGFPCRIGSPIDEIVVIVFSRYGLLAWSVKR
jgi:hypothetical protein